MFNYGYKIISLQEQLARAEQMIAWQNNHISHFYSIVGVLVGIIGILLGVYVFKAFEINKIKSDIKKYMEDEVENYFYEKEQLGIEKQIESCLNNRMRCQELKSHLCGKKLSKENINKFINTYYDIEDSKYYHLRAQGFGEIFFEILEEYYEEKDIKDIVDNFFQKCFDKGWKLYMQALNFYIKDTKKYEIKIIKIIKDIDFIKKVYETTLFEVLLNCDNKKINKAIKEKIKYVIENGDEYFQIINNMQNLEILNEFSKEIIDNLDYKENEDNTISMFPKSEKDRITTVNKNSVLGKILTSRK